MKKILRHQYYTESGNPLIHQMRDLAVFTDYFPC